MRINIRKSMPLFATGLACIGVIATTYLAAKKTPEATERLKQAKEKAGNELNALESVKAVLPVYWPVCAAGTATVACIIGIQALNQKQQASLIAMYGVAAKSLQKYDGKVKELFGVDFLKQVKTAIAQDSASEQILSHPDHDELLFYDMISGRYFNSTMFAVREAEYHFNRNFILRGGQATLNELYDFLDLEHIEGGDVAGWDICQIGEFYGYEWVDFEHELTKIIGDSGEVLECYILSCPFPPCYLDLTDEFDPIEFESAKNTLTFVKEA